MKCHNINDKKQIVKRFEAGMLCQEYGIDRREHTRCKGKCNFLFHPLRTHGLTGSRVATQGRHRQHVTGPLTPSAQNPQQDQPLIGLCRVEGYYSVTH